MAVTCGAELNNAMASAINVLGDVHGGAGQQCMELYAMVKARADERLRRSKRRSRPSLPEYFEKHGKIVAGFGHRWHPVDPRTAPLLDAGRGGGGRRRGFRRICRHRPRQSKRC